MSRKYENNKKDQGDLKMIELVKMEKKSEIKISES